MKCHEIGGQKFSFRLIITTEFSFSGENENSSLRFTLESEIVETGPVK